MSAPPLHDAILIEAPIDDLEIAISTTQALMADVSALVLDGFRLRSDAKVIKHPDRYMDERGTRMRDTVWDILRDRMPCARVHAICAPVQLYLCMSAHHLCTRATLPVHECTPVQSYIL